jgi:hypothetical protein
MSTILSKRNFAWVMLMIAIASVCAVIYFDMHISQMQHDYLENQASISKRSAQESSAAHLHALLAQTQAQRSMLDSLVNTDVVSIVDTFDKVGKATGVTVQIVSTASESTPPKTQKPIASTLAFTIETSGSFAQVIRSIELLSTLPIPSQVEQYDLSYGGGVWTANVRVRIYTDATV